MGKIFFIFLLIIIITIAACSDKKSQVNILQQNMTAQASESVQTSIFDKPFLSDPNTETIEYPDANIYYENNQIIYSYNPKTKEKKKLAEGQLILSLPPSKSKLIYNIYKDNKVYTYLLNPKIMEVKEINTVTFHINNTDWSPDERYLFTQYDAGIVAQDFGVVDTLSNKTWDFMSSDELGYSHAWISDTELVFMRYIDSDSKRTQEKYEIYGYDKSDFNICILDCSTGIIRVLRHSNDPKEDYKLIYVKNNKIFYEKLTVSNTKDWESRNNVVATELVMDKDGNDLSLTTEDTILFNHYNDEMNKFSKFYSEVEDKLPFPKESYFNQITKLSSNNKWLLLELSDRNVAPNKNKGIFIMDIDNPQSLIQIDTGRSAQW